MKFSLAVAGVLWLASFGAVAASHPPGYYGYGRAPTPAEIAGWNIDVRPDGRGLPPGSGTVSQGEKLFESKCAACHGDFGEGMGRYPKLNDPSLADLKADRPTKTVGNYWPYATTIYDYVHRAMPFYAPESLKPDEVYAITAYLLNLNNIVGSDFVANAETLPKVKMPNRHGFIFPDPRPDTHNKECMHNCKNTEQSKVMSNAAQSSLTPTIKEPAYLIMKDAGNQD